MVYAPRSPAGGFLQWRWIRDLALKASLEANAGECDGTYLYWRARTRRAVGVERLALEERIEQLESERQPGLGADRPALFETQIQAIEGIQSRTRARLRCAPVRCADTEGT